MKGSTKIIIALSIVIALLQVFDIVIHVTTDQAEAIRITSNVIIMVWLLGVMTGKAIASARYSALAAIAAYLALNAVFLALEGVVNSESGELRTTLFLLVALSTALSTIVALLLQRAGIGKV